MQKLINLYKKYNEIINYLIVGALTVLITLIAYYICVSTFLNPNNNTELQIANIISWIIAVIFAYITNRIFVFKSKSKKIFKESITFISSRIITLLLDMLTMYLMVSICNINDKISKLVSQIIVIILNYIFSKIYVFNKKN